MGLGTWNSGPKEFKEAVTEALKIGYRILTQQRYMATKLKVGQGIKDSGVDRKDIFVR